MAAEPELVRPRVVLATMSREHISRDTHVSIFRAGTTGRIVHHLVIGSGPYLDAGRNKAVHGAVTIPTKPDESGPWDWFLFVDSDIEFTLEQFDALFAVVAHPSYNPRTYPIIGGVYVNPFDDEEVDGEEPNEEGFRGQVGPVCYEWRERDDLPGQLQGVPTPTFVRLSRTNLAQLPPVNEPWNPSGDNGPSPVCQVAAIGTGFLAVHHDFFTLMGERYGEPLPWFDEPVVHGVHYGEDMGFAIRVADMGYPVLAHRGVTPIHNKTMKLV